MLNIHTFSPGSEVSASVSAFLGITCGRTPRKHVFTFILRPVKQTHPRCPSVSPLCHPSSLYPSAASCPGCCGAAGQIQQLTVTLLHQRTSARMFKRYFSWRGARIPFVHFIRVTAQNIHIFMSPKTCRILFLTLYFFGIGLVKKNQPCHLLITVIDQGC